MKLTYNAPFILTYTFVCLAITAIDQSTDPNFAESFFMVYPFNTAYMEFSNPLTYFRLFSHAMGHGGWEHFLGNFSLILLLGPILEEKYGTKQLLSMSFVTALITGILNALLFNNALLGASGVVFMLILLSSFTNMRAGVIPLTFILVAALFLGKEIYTTLVVTNNVSEFAHIIGGVFGAIFGYFAATPKPNSSNA
ncbi:MAG: rhomboid family intramembrane serine protease [Cytophagales bacterium]|nr:MAG: rhomboid family intramembrane serine protease [Cytophagales bacterium]